MGRVDNLESRIKDFILCGLTLHYNSCYSISTYSAKICHQERLVLATTLWQHAKMSTILKNLGGLKDSECEKGQLSTWPPIPYMPLTDLLATKEPASKNLMIKLPDGTVFPMTIFSRGITEEYLAHIITVRNLIN
jgi:hypothetical protein